MTSISAAYAIICVTCEDTALFRTQYSLPALFTQRIALREPNPHLLAKDGFECCQADRLLLTLCWRCERARAEQYGLNLTLNVPARHPHARLANPNLSVSLVRAWPAINRIMPFIRTSSLFGSSDDARPILKIELISLVLNNGEDTNYEYVGMLDVNRQWVDRRAYFFVPPTV